MQELVWFTWRPHVELTTISFVSSIILHPTRRLPVFRRLLPSCRSKTSPVLRVARVGSSPRPARSPRRRRRPLTRWPILRRQSPPHPRTMIPVAMIQPMSALPCCPRMLTLAFLTSAGVGLAILLTGRLCQLTHLLRQPCIQRT